MQAHLCEFINKLRSNPTVQTFNETIVKQAVILPLVQLLGWAPFDPEEVYPEYTVKTMRVDYSLRIRDTDVVFIEVKKPEEDLERHQEQLLLYSFHQGVGLAVLTNGITWWFYLPRQAGDWPERKFYTLDLLEQDTENVASMFIGLLAKDNVKSGKSLETAERLYGDRRKKQQVALSMPQAWNKIVREPDDLLVQLLAETTEKLCGFKPDDDKAIEFLRSHQEDLCLDMRTGPRATGKGRALSQGGGSETSNVIPRQTGAAVASRPGRKGYEQLNDYVFPVVRLMKKGISHARAFRMQAQTLGVAHETVQAQCTRVLGIDTATFADQVASGRILSLLLHRYPARRDEITRSLAPQ